MTKPGVGVCVLLLNNSNEILLMKRRGSHGEGTWGLPGGKIELSESAWQTAVRELREEVGVLITRDMLKQYEWCDSHWTDHNGFGLQHWITLFYVARKTKHQEVAILEPDKCSELRWASIYEILEIRPLFKPLENFIERFPPILWPLYYQ